MPKITRAGIVLPTVTPLSIAASALRKAVKRWRAAYNKRATIEALSALDDHQLRDIGLTRNGIRHAADHASRMNMW